MLLQPGKSLRKTRERLGLKYRDVEEASQRVATRHKNQEFVIGLSRLADIENKGTLPTIYRMYSLAVIYGTPYRELLDLYGISLDHLAGDVAESRLHITRPFGLSTIREDSAELPTGLLNGFDGRNTNYVIRQIQDWGTVPLHFLKGLDFSSHRYAIVGTGDWSMFPLIPPGSFVQIDETKRRVVNGGWDSDYSRPIYFLLLHEGYRFAWCTERAGSLIVQPHSSAPVPAEVFRYPEEVEILGQAIGVAMRFDRVKPRRTSFS